MSMVPYNNYASQLAPYARAAASTPYGRAAYMGYQAWQRRDQIRAAGSFAARAARNSKKYFARKRAQRNKHSRNKIGEPVGTSGCKTAVTDDNNPTNYDTRTIYSFELTDLGEGYDRDQRLRKIINLRGFKICLELLNKASNSLYVNVAVLSPKDSNGGISATSFFRGNDYARGIDFGNALNGLEFHCLPINTDKYNILSHQRYQLVSGTGTGTTVDLQSRNHTTLDFYVKLNRQLRYDSGSSTPTDGAVYLVVWCDTFGAQTAQTPVAAQLQMTRRAVTYFREPVYAAY